MPSPLPRLASLALLLFACNRPVADPAAQAEQKAPTEAPSASEESRAAASPGRARVSRADEYFWITLEGPAFSSPQKFTFEPDAVRANVISKRSAIQYVRQGQTPAHSADGSQIVMLQAQFAGSGPGEYPHDDKRTFVVTLGVETAARDSATLQVRAGKLIADVVSRQPRELKGSFEGELSRTNKGREDEVYKITGQFNLAE